MSLRSIGKEFFQSGSQRMQSVKDTAPENDSSVKSLKKAACTSASSKQKTNFSGLTPVVDDDDLNVWPDSIIRRFGSAASQNTVLFQ
ncbi:hypothetical protein SADUNF_Sadunf19G0108300 [Salix dunnii]|uniref:Uncharacterized protein n=1 Tax=Salix dunnii TaxID=1413687 RepID=A0A835IZI2_9ROSI|nr:hypothetical protein SADUNF_Sadunf19G0108300 [Salix dunnii]